MPATELHLLAETDPMKLIGGLVVVAFWLIGAAVTALTKKKELAQREEARRSQEIAARARGQIPQVIEAPQASQARMFAPQKQRPPIARVSQPAAAPFVPQFAPPLPPNLAEGVRMRVPQQPKRKTQKQSRARPAPVAPPPVPKATEPDPSHLSVSAPPMQSPTAKQHVPVAAAELNDWLRPQTLRKQFIVTELLQPPLSLRE